MPLAPPVFHPWFLNRAPSEYRVWMADTGSLTERLVDFSNGQFEVVPLRECWRGLTGPEARALGLRPGLRVLQREVELHCHGVACVYAHSLLPLPVLQGRRALASLGNRSLGSLLFADPTLERESMHALPPTPALPHWGRRSCFRIGGHPLFVSEYFLPALFKE